MRVFSLKSTRLLFIIKIIVCGLRIIGLAPFAMSFKSSVKINPLNSPVEIFQVSKIGQFYNILFLIPVLMIVTAKFYLPYIFPDEDSSKEPTDSADAEALVLTVEAVLLILAACVVVISWAKRQRKATFILNKLLEIDLQFSLFKQQSFNRQGLVLFIIHVVVNVSLWVTFWLKKIEYFRINSFLPTFLVKIPDYIIYWFIIEYFVVVSVIAEHLETVNMYLINFNEFGNYLSRPTNASRNGTLIQVLTLANGDSDSQLFSLRLLHKIRTTLLDLCENIADFFSLPILFCIICCFIPLVRELFVVSKFSEDENAWVAEAIPYIFLTICLYVYPVLSLALKVTQAETETKRTGYIIHKLLAAPYVGPEVKAELTQFSLQVLHEDVKFTAFGFFTLDSRLLFSMLGGTASYFIALTQFRSACTCKYTEIASAATTPKSE